MIWKIRLIGKPKLPERDNVAKTCFNIIFNNIALLYTLYLLLLFLLAAYLEGVFLCNEEV